MPAPIKLFGNTRIEISDAWWAMKAIQLENGSTAATIRKEKLGNIGESSEAIKPATVMGATAAETRRLAGMETNENCPEIAMIIGVQKIVAASGIAIGSGIFRAVRIGTRTKIPAVAPTDNAKPGSTDWKGSIKISTVIANPSAGNPPALAPRARAKRRAAVITDARITEGEGRTR